MTAILGISAFYHDSAAALVVDGQIVAAAQEERFTRRKHDHEFPVHAAEYCLQFGGLSVADLDYVGFYEKPLRHFDRLLESWLAFAPRGYRAFRLALPIWLRQKLHLPREIHSGIGPGYTGRIIFTQHHESHAASAFFPSPFEDAAILTMDGVGEWATTCIGRGHGNRIELLDELRFPHSPGLLYSAFTNYTGFRVNSGEYKLMGLAPYGTPVYKDLITQHLIDLKDDGSFRMDMRYFRFAHGLTMTSARFHKLFGGPPRHPEAELTQRDMDLAASVQSVTEDIVLKLAEQTHRRTGLNHLVLAGGVALNCVANGRVLREGPFSDLWIQPAAGDAGGALGNALFVWHQLLNKPRIPQTPDAQQGSLLGPEFTSDEIQSVLDQHGIVYKQMVSDDDLCDRTSQLLADEQVVGWFQGRMEFGPRALGARSILADARSPRMQSVMNLKIKFRESFRPFAPIVLREYADQYFDIAPHRESPYMLVVAPVSSAVRIEEPPDALPVTGLQRLARQRSRIPAVTHVDHSARLQTVDNIRNPLLHRLLSSFYRLTNCPILVNTSFNVRGEPIVCTPNDAVRGFLMTEMDVLAIGRFLVRKSDQTISADSQERREHLRRFRLD